MCFKTKKDEAEYLNQLIKLQNESIMWPQV